MKILVITARHPPYHFGGYEIRCKNIMDELFSRGYEILVLTSVKEVAENQSHDNSNYKVFRKLHLRHKTRGFIDEITSDFLDLEILEGAIRRFHPDVIYLGHITLFSKALMPYLAECKIPIVYDEGGSGLIDSWMERGIWFYFIERYTSKHSILNFIKPFVINVIRLISRHKIKPQWMWPRNMHVFFNSELNRKNAIDCGVPIQGGQIIHSGVDINKFFYRSRSDLGHPLLFILPGRVEPKKGQLDGVRLVAKLIESDVVCKMTIVGDEWSASYHKELIDEIEQLHLKEKVQLMPMIMQQKLADLYQTADICFFPSYFKTGYSRVPLEAMACGSIVISYGNEGSDEIIKDRQTGFIVPAGNLQFIAEIVRDLISNPGMVCDIREAARNEIEEYCSLDRYVSNIERFIINAGGNA